MDGVEGIRSRYLPLVFAGFLTPFFGAAAFAFEPDLAADFWPKAKPQFCA